MKGTHTILQHPAPPLWNRMKCWLRPHRLQGFSSAITHTSGKRCTRCGSVWLRGPS